jgi:hypothetical protein
MDHRATCIRARDVAVPVDQLLRRDLPIVQLLYTLPNSVQSVGLYLVRMRVDSTLRQKVSQMSAQLSAAFLF